VPLTYKTTPPGFAASFWRSGRIAVFRYDAFLSYAHDGGEKHTGGEKYALALWPRLEELGLTTCFDRADFHPGDRLRMKMHRSVTASRSLIVLDTERARTSPEVAREIAAATEAGMPVVVIRKAGLGKSPWRNVEDAEDELIHIPESVDRFVSGDPSEEAIRCINERHRATRVAVKFQRLVLAVAGALALSGGWLLVDAWFSARVRAVYAAVSDPAVSIDAIDRAYRGLQPATIRAVWHAWHKDDVKRLGVELWRLQVKHRESDLTRALRRAMKTASIHESPASAPLMTVLSARSAVIAIHDGVLSIHEATSSAPCFATEGRAVAVAATSDERLIAVATTRGVYVWHDGGCRSQPRSVEPVFSPSDHPRSLSFGNNDRSLLVADREHAVIFGCDKGTCGETVRRTAADATPPETTGPTQFCRALLSPTSELLVTAVGQCTTANQLVDICAFSEPMRCEHQSNRWPVAIDGTGNWLVAKDPWLTAWDLTGMAPLRTARPQVVKSWRFRKDFQTVGSVDQLAFAPQGTRVFAAVRLVEDRSSLVVYRWGVEIDGTTRRPTVEVLHIETLPSPPNQIIVGQQAVVAGRQEIIALDYRP